MDDYLPRLAEWFEAFAAGYMRQEAGKGVLALKRDHSLRVLDECRRLTREENFAPGLAKACHAAALLHDVGRFPQYQKYRTLRDALSVNHASLSVATLTRQGALSALDDATRRLILYAIALHNRKSPPQSPSMGLDRAVKVLRDADKLDIIRVMLGHFELESADREAAFFGLDPDPEGLSRPVVEAVLARRMADHAGMRFSNDFYLLVLSWVYDLNFTTSRRLFLTRGYIDEICARLPRLPEMDKVRLQATSDLTK